MRISILIAIQILLINCLTFGTTKRNVSDGNTEVIYVGTFSERGSLGIYVYNYDREVNRYDLLQTIISKESPSFIDTSPDGKYLFSANRGSVEGKEKWGSVTSFAIDQSTGELMELNTISSFGDSPCHISVHPSGKHVFVSHYRGGNFTIFPIDDHGKIGDPTANIQLEGKGTVMPRQEKPHTHSAVSSNDGKFLYVSDLGLDKILIYKFDSNNGTVQPAEQSFIRTMPGAGPRHFTFNKKGNLAFSAEEISSSICSYRVNKENGELQLIRRLPTLPPEFFGNNSSADIHCSADGKYVYISNRGYDGLSIYKVNGKGKMKEVGYMPTGGEKPRSFLPEPKGEFMLVGNRDSDLINIFSINKDGTLIDIKYYLSVPSPVCIKYLELK